jgi:hypothetical protein
MSAFLALPLALLPPTLEGVLLLRILEGVSPVLGRLERWCMGHFLGITASSFVIFWALLLGLPLTVGGFAAVHGVLLLLLGGVAWWNGVLRAAPCKYSLSLLQTLDRPLYLLVLGLSLWIVLKIAASSYDLLISPNYFDDTYANWNMRAKVFYTSESLLLDLPKDHEFFFGGRVPSYPMTVYFVKVWLAQVNGALQGLLGSSVEGWSDPLVNSVHLIWFLAFLVVFAAAIARASQRRDPRQSWLMVLLGLYLLTSLPLFLIHGASAYVDVLLGGYIFLVLTSFYEWLGSVQSSPKQARTWLLLMSSMASAMLFVKSEALLIFLPPFLLLFGSAALLWQQRWQSSLRALLLPFSIIAATGVPWVLFKISQGLTFGNAQAVSQLPLAFHAGVPTAIYHGLFNTGSFLFLFPLILFVIALTTRSWFRGRVSLLLVFLVMVLFGEFLIYAFTPLATEALRHTGFSRGVVQLLPLLVFVLLLLLQELFENTLHSSRKTECLPPLEG